MSEFVCEIAPDEFGELTEVARLGEEIVRCRDCKWFRQHHQLSPFGDYYDYNTCGQIDGITVRAIDPDGYCAWGEKR